MLIQFLCVHCQGSLEVDAKGIGAQVACPHCGKRITIPKQGIGSGATIGGFYIERKLAAGGMGEIYIARQLSMDRVVALKILPKHLGLQEDMSERFLHELRLLARLEHPNIVTAYEAGEDAGILYFAMAYIQGESLAARIKQEGYLDEQPALVLTRKLASALAYAWNEHQLLHRDIKPSNILLDKTGEPKLVDFGLAKSVSAQAGLTLSSVMMGTPNYMSSEQSEDFGTVDVRADMYSLGATLYNMVTGKIPFAGSSVMDIIKKQVTEPLRDPREFNPDLSDETVALLEILLAKDRNERHETWEAVIADMDRVLAGQAPIQPMPESGHSVLVRVRDKAILAELKNRPKGKNRNRSREALDKEPLTRESAGGGKPARTTLWLAGAGVAAIAIIGVILTLVLKNPGKPPESFPIGGPGAPVRDVGPPHVSGVASAAADGSRQRDSRPRAASADSIGDAAARAKQAYMQALEYIAVHPDDLTGSLTRFEAVKKEAAGTEYQAKADEQLKRLEELKKRAVEKAWLPLKAEADNLVAGGKSQEAVDKLEQFNGAYAAELASLREAMAGALKARLAEAAKVKEAMAEKERQAQVEKEAAAKKEEVQQQFVEMRRQMAAKLLNSDFPGATALVQVAKRNRVLTDMGSEVTEAELMIQKLAGLPDMLAGSFEKDKGKEVAIEFKGGQTRTLQIAGMEGRNVKTRRALPQGFVEQEFALADISANERLKRLAGNPAPEAAILRGLAAYEAKNASVAQKEFSTVGGLVGTALAEAVSAEADQASAEGYERAAREALQALVQLAGLPARQPTGAAGVMNAPIESNWVAAVGEMAYTSNQAMRIHATVAEFRGRYGKTAVAKENGPLLEALAAVISAPSGVKMVDLGGGVKLEMVWIRPGEFLMGSPMDENGRQSHESPQHNVRLTKGFWLGKYEVTQEQWEKVMGYNPSHFKGTRLPVEQVNWNDCQEFIKKLNALARNDKFRLPTEAEWEYACRAGTTTRFHTGDSDRDMDHAGWHRNNGGGTTHVVGQKEKNAWGLYDMHGNVWEWCQDWFGGYDFGGATDPAGPSSGSSNVLRGGSWAGESTICRSALRSKFSPMLQNYDIGFRLVGMR